MYLNLKRIKAERIAKGYTQEYMAEKMGFNNRSAYAKRENGIVNIGADELAQIAEILEIPSNQLSIFFTLSVPKRERGVH
ncbi:helix-turn-helix domain-containing protein [Aerococcus christensenii]|uniref:helix-turn-helix domain-containing protein n=1 Tax=Aerococcus christensenii TaxID=87541 RepID=UPI0023A928AA|nr:helix-turn-helix transcriptional regulator [Aerococcus christensenii]WEB70577.1 helix-turn-helix transcriptional regulator [Aerococcus christensenii]